MEDRNNFVTAGELIEHLSQAYKKDEIISYNVYGKSEVEDELDCKITEEQWTSFIIEWEHDDVLNEIRQQSWDLCVDNLRQELGIEE